jgi:hypothetical protein
VTGLAARDAIRVRDLRWEPGGADVVLVAYRETAVVVGAPPGMTIGGADEVAVTLPVGEPVRFACTS